MSVHGVRGFVKVVPWCDDVQIFKVLPVLYLDCNGLLCENISQVKFVKNFVLVRFSHADTVEKASQFLGRLLYVDRCSIPLKDGEIFIQDLIGVKVCDFSNKEVCYGNIVEVLKTGANDVYSILDEKSGVRRFVPVIDSVVLEKDLDNNVIYINVLEGLFDV